jgi:hypothetical protein
MTRPSPRPRPKPKAALGVNSPKVTVKSDSERLTGVPDKPPAPPQKQITYFDTTYIRSETPIGFEAATFCKTGVDLAPGNVA